MTSQKLYRVTLRGMQHNPTGAAIGVSYVVAENSDEAYKKVKEFVDRKDIGFSRERELEKVELIADEYEYANTPHILFL